MIEYKVPGGKLLRITLETDSGKIRKIRIRGDFFLHPEESISLIERSLIGLSIEEVPGKLKEVARDNGITIIGFDEVSLADAIAAYH